MHSPQEYFRALVVEGYELTIRREGSQVILEWPLECGNCTLLMSSQLGAGAVWTPSIVAPIQVNGRYRVTLSIGVNPKYYRLAIPID